MLIKIGFVRLEDFLHSWRASRSLYGILTPFLEDEQLPGVTGYEYWKDFKWLHDEGEKTKPAHAFIGLK
jgi:hypothetical protein